jgi:hypothetical protein
LERNEITVHPETLRRWLKREGVAYPQRKRKGYRKWRERKACSGEMVQLDGSHHPWLEERGPEMTLMAYIDDATNRVYARFYEYEGTFPALDSLWRYLQQYGMPQSLYADRHETYKSSKVLTIEEELAGKEQPESQFQRAVRELGIELIHALTPQAKGRIERQFKTFQDRLVKEMRLEGIATLEQANSFLEDYLPRYNQRFMKPAALPTDLHQKVPSKRTLSSILCRKDVRRLRQDGTVRYQNHWYQLQVTRGSQQVDVQEWLDGSLHFFQASKELVYREIFPAPSTAPLPQTPSLRFHRRAKPPPDHPWRKYENRTAKNKSQGRARSLQGTTF